MYGLSGEKEYKNAMIVSLDPNTNKVLSFYETMKGNGDIDPNTPYKMEDQIDSSIYRDALQVLLDRGENAAIYERLMEEFEINN